MGQDEKTYQGRIFSVFCKEFRTIPCTGSRPFLAEDLSEAERPVQQTLPEKRFWQGFSVYNKDKEFAMNINKTVFGLGLFIALIAATLLVLGFIESGIAAAIGILGIGLIAASGRDMPKQK